MIYYHKSYSEENSSCNKEEHADLAIPKNGKNELNGQTFTIGVAIATNWKTSDIGKVVYESALVQAGTTPNKYAVFATNVLHLVTEIFGY
ncbi:hypothetical protein J2T12_003391 [Paenibacillus anaericanus]|uniref:hypothetical protein n=1 Tax=Paenibacillus anaericanus TaxID=170367 RepID=UPI0027886C3B|nr:hypothetical protein [Paenibacillus anaericanus]MDQ0089978.1 hypothetical protein [Paenibacillus anaericanus]